MSYDIYFLKDGVVCQLPFTTPTGGTHCLDPNHREAWFNMTYNYYEIMASHGIGIYRHKDDPKDYKFCGTKTEVIRQIGNAVCPKLSEALITAALSA